MKFKLDTNDYENISLTITDEDLDQKFSFLLEDFSYAVSAFFIDFAMQLDYNTDQAEDLKNVFLKLTDRNIDLLLNEGLLELPEEDF